jgi:hypothetical protein
MAATPIGFAGLMIMITLYREQHHGAIRSHEILF